MVADSYNLEARFKGGGSIIGLPPVFSEDGQFVYLLWKDMIISYNTKTAKRVCEFRNGRQQIIGFSCTYGSSGEYIVACTDRGKVTIWKANNALKLRELKLKVDQNVKVKYLKIITNKRVDGKTPEALVCFENSNSNMYEFSLLNLDSGQLERQGLRLRIDAENIPIFIDVSRTARYFVVVRGKNMYFSIFGSNHIKYSIKGRTFTCIACHPEEEAVLTGDNTGRILLWQNIAKKKKATQAVYHWHTLPVDTICFSTSGTYFYSGGAECVLVKWDQTNNNFKNFLPRLPGHIKHICVAENNVVIAAATKDNAIQIISPQLYVVNTIQHLALGNDNCSGIVFDPRSKSLVLNGVVGHVQFFSSRDMNLMYNLDVVGQNKFSNERDKDVISTTVYKVALSNTGIWMATVEQRLDPDMFEARLKFWFYDSAKQNFCLNTSIEYPHEEQVLDIVFQSTGNDFELRSVTVGNDKKVKVWQLVNVETIDYQGHSWRCSGQVTYKDLNPQVATFSNDGSLIIAGFESIITAWLSDNYKLKCSLKHPFQNDKIIHLSFGSGSDSHLVFCATSKYISVWNLLSLSLVWTVRVDVSIAISDIRTPFKAVFTKDKKLFILDLKSSKPIYSSKKILKYIGDVQAAVFVPKNFISSDINMVWYRTTCIYFLDTNYELYSIETKGDSTDFHLHIEETNTSLYSHLVPKMGTNITSKANVTHMYEKGNSANQFRKFLDTPATALPPLHLICEGILQSMILQHEVGKAETRGNEQDSRQHAADQRKEEKSEYTKESDKLQDSVEIAEQLSKINKEPTDWVSILLNN